MCVVVIFTSSLALHPGSSSIHGQLAQKYVLRAALHAHCTSLGSFRESVCNPPISSVVAVSGILLLYPQR